MQHHEPVAPPLAHQSKPAAKCPFSASSTAKPASLADALREQTKDAHSRAEKHPLQARMIKGEVDLEHYAQWLDQMLHIWKALDAALEKLSARDPRVAAMLKPYHPHAARIAADLKFLGNVGGCPAVPAASGFAAWATDAAANTDPAVVGAWYVLEGSSNGGRFIAKALSRGLGIAGPEGLTSFDPHGEAQRERWQSWRADLDAQPWNHAERTAIIAAADATFDAIWSVMEELSSQPTHS